MSGHSIGRKGVMALYKTFRERCSEKLSKEIGAKDVWHFIAPILLKATLALLCALLCVQSFYLSMSVFTPFEQNETYVHPYYYEITFKLLFLFFLTLSIPFRRAYIPVGIAFVLLQLIAAINYYELMFRDTVFTWQDIYNFKTALAVAGNYRFPLNTESRFILLSALLIVLITVLLSRLHVCARRNILLTIVCFWLLLSNGSTLLKGKIPDPWSWEDLYYERGFIVGTIQYICSCKTQIREPEGYSASALPEPQGLKGNLTDYPDIVFVLNESFYDLRHLIKFESDENPLCCFDSLNGYKGFAAVPLAGGGTNDSEYELLTGNSLSLINNYSPFSTLDLRESNSVVSYLEQLGYATMAAHPESSGNYHRGRVWRQLGFDECFFLEDFIDIEFYGERKFATDTSAFVNFQRMYEAMPTEQPRFAYLLTVQNHGGYILNPPELDIIHLSGDSHIPFPSTVNEYLSSLRLTDAFIEQMQVYFSKCGRRVIVYMVGDHAPYFSTRYMDAALSSQELFLIKRQVPYFIWANFDLTGASFPENHDIDLCALTPYTLRIAGLPLSPYYAQLLKISEFATCFTNTIPPEKGKWGAGLGYIKTDGTYGSLNEDTVEANKVRDYF